MPFFRVYIGEGLANIGDTKSEPVESCLGSGVCGSGVWFLTASKEDTWKWLFNKFKCVNERVPINEMVGVLQVLIKCNIFCELKYNKLILWGKYLLNYCNLE